MKSTLGFIFGVELIFRYHLPFDANWKFWIVIFEMLIWTACYVMSFVQLVMDKVVLDTPNEVVRRKEL